MTCNVWRCAPLAAALCCACGCGLMRMVVTTDVEVRGGHRSIEQQVLGVFDHVGEDVYLLAGVRTIDPATGDPSPAPPMTPGRERALEARRRMEFNRDDLLRFEREGLVGEGNMGLPVVFDDRISDLAARDERAAALVRQVVAEETADRLTIIARIVDTVPELSGEEGRLRAQRILAARYRQEAEPGTRVQLPDGAWVAAER